MNEREPKSRMSKKRTNTTNEEKAPEAPGSQGRKPRPPDGASDPTPAARRFLAKMEVKILVDNQLLQDVLTNEWRSSFYPLNTAEDVAEHLVTLAEEGQDAGSLVDAEQRDKVFQRNWARFADFVKGFGT